MNHIAFILISLIFIIACCVFALVLGRKAEKLGAICVLAANFSAEVMIGLFRDQYPGTDILIIDFLLAVALLFLAVRYSSLWLGCAMILQGIALYTHALGLLGDEVSSQLYIRLIDILTYSMAACIFLGTASHLLHKKRESLQRPFKK